MADGRRSNKLATAKGTAMFKVLDSSGTERQFLLNNALLAPGIPASLFSVRAATDAGAHICFTKGMAKLTACNTTFDINKVGQLYFLPTLPSQQNQAYVTRTLEEWHKTFGHMNYDDILQLYKQLLMA
jgi:hypothetical protein